MTYGGKTRATAVAMFTNSRDVTQSDINIDSIKNGFYSVSFDSATYMTTLRNSIVLPQGAFQRVSSLPVRMGLTNTETTSSNIKSSQAHEPTETVTAALIWTRGGRGQALTPSDSYTATAGYITYSVLHTKD